MSTDAPLPPTSATPGELPRWTIERMDLFIRALIRTRNVAGAARAAGMSRQAAYKLRARLRGHPFDLAWEAAMVPQARFRRMVAEHARELAGSRAGSQAAIQGATEDHRG